MKKSNKVNSNIKSDVACCHCNNKLKKNLVARKPTADCCYDCYRIHRAKKSMLTAKEVRRNPHLQSKERIKRNVIVKRSAS